MASGELDALDIRGAPPTMCFASELRVEYKGQPVLRLDTCRLLGSVGCRAPEDLRVHTDAQEYWGSLSVSLARSEYDWTFRPDLAALLPTNLSPDRGIDYAFLRADVSEIKYYSELCFYEDEIGDAGKAVLESKLRVMPWGYFILIRHFLRIDRVGYRVTDWRFLHREPERLVVLEERRGSLEWSLALGKDEQAIIDSAFMGAPTQNSTIKIPFNYWARQGRLQEDFAPLSGSLSPGREGRNERYICGSYRMEAVPKLAVSRVL